MCAKLLVSMASFFIDISSDCVFSTGRSFSILSQSEDFFHRLTYFEPRDYRVDFVLHKKSRPEDEISGADDGNRTRVVSLGS